jgi:hypothetical protein
MKLNTRKRKKAIKGFNPKSEIDLCGSTDFVISV